MSNIPTAEEFFMKFKHTHSPVNHHLALIEFAKLHVKAALEAVNKECDNEIEKDFINQDLILNAYSLTNIK